MRVVSSMLAASAALVVAVPAQAAFIEVSGTGTGTGFFFTGSPTPPASVPVSLSFNVVFDTDTGTCGTLCVASLTPAGFSFTFNNQINGRGLRVAVDAVSGRGGTLSGLWSYSEAGSSGNGASGSGAISLSTRARPDYTGPGTFSATLAPAVPEPATWATMLAGFALVGGAVRRRRTALAA